MGALGKESPVKRCQLCGSAMRVDAELMEGERHYCWYKCLNINCGGIFLVQKTIRKRPGVESQESASAAAG